MNSNLAFAVLFAAAASNEENKVTRWSLGAATVAYVVAWILDMIIWLGAHFHG